MFVRLVSVFVISFTVSSAGLCGQEWHQFRGPLGNGHAKSGNLPVEWGESKNVSWKTTIPGKGWSSPVISGNQIWMTTSIAKDDGPVELRAICVDFESGNIVHNVKLFELATPEKIHTMNSYASPTPAIAGRRVFCHFGNYGTAALDVESGEVEWKLSHFDYDTQNGPGASPVVWKELLLFNCDGRDKQFAVALDQKTGSTVWKVDRSGKLHENEDFKKSYCTPAIVNCDGKDLLISPAADWVYAYEPATGKEVWKAGYGELGFSCVPKPVFQDGKAYVLTSFMKSRLLAIDCKGKGDVTDSNIRWTSKTNMPSKPSLVIVDDLLYAVSDKGILTCLDTKNGNEVYKQRVGGNFAASPLYSNGNIYLFDTRGRTTVFKAGPEFKIIQKNALEGMFMASPAVKEDSLILRTDKALYRVD